MATNVAVRMMGQGATPDVVREETVLMLKRIFLVLAVLIVLSLVISKRDQLIQMVDHPISSVKVSGAFSYLKESEVSTALSDLIGVGFIAIDLKDVQARVEALPWVESALVSRVWPGEVKLVVTEQHAVTQWNNQALLNSSGVAFTPKEISHDLLALPKLIGSERFSVAKKASMIAMYQTLESGLSSYGLQVAELELKPRNVWNMQLENGVMVAMGEIKLDDVEGRQTLDAKLERLGKVFNAISQLDVARIARIDARYPNGVAIKWHD